MSSGREIVRVVIAVALTCIVAASAANAPPDQQPPVRYWDLPTGISGRGTLVSAR